MQPASCSPVCCDISRLPGRGVSAPNPHVKVQWLRVRVTESIAEADKLSQNGDIRAARAVIDGMLEAIDLSSADDGSRSDPLVEQLVADLNRIRDGLPSDSSYAMYGGHRMLNTMQMHETQRCVDSFGSLNAYRGKYKSRTLNKFTNK